jgi:hypothetical protein
VLFVKTHEQNHAFLSNWPAIHIVRDGRDALVSHAHYVRDFEKSPQAHIEVLNTLVQSRDWSVHAMLWFDRPNTVRIRYEDMIADPVSAVRSAVEALQLPLRETGRKPPAFAELQKRHPNPHFYRRGIVGSHRDEMPPAIERLFWHHHRQAMELLGYSP